jgi:hypothetical protein
VFVDLCVIAFDGEERLPCRVERTAMVMGVVRRKAARQHAAMAMGAEPLFYVAPGAIL